MRSWQNANCFSNQSAQVKLYFTTMPIPASFELIHRFLRHWSIIAFVKCIDISTGSKYVKIALSLTLEPDSFSSYSFSELHHMLSSPGIGLVYFASIHSRSAFYIFLFVHQFYFAFSAMCFCIRAHLTLRICLTHSIVNIRRSFGFKDPSSSVVSWP